MPSRAGGCDLRRRYPGGQTRHNFTGFAVTQPSPSRAQRAQEPSLASCPGQVVGLRREIETGSGGGNPCTALWASEHVVAPVPLSLLPVPPVPHGTRPSSSWHQPSVTATGLNCERAVTAQGSTAEPKPMSYHFAIQAPEGGEAERRPQSQSVDQPCRPKFAALASPRKLSTAQDASIAPMEGPKAR